MRMVAAAVLEAARTLGAEAAVIHSAVGVT
jgi:hypothetical protein